MENKRVHELIDADFEEMSASLSELVRIPSIFDENSRTEEHPFGVRVTEALDKFLDVANKLGFRTKNIDNAVGYAEIGEGSLIGALVHLDVMPAGNELNWKYPPFGAEIAAGKMYGRGTNDDKGPAVSVLYAAYALASSGVKLNKRFRIIAGLDEESGFRCIERYKRTEEIPEMSFSPDGSFPVVNGEKGILHFVMSRRVGKTNSAGLPELADIKGGDRFNIVPDKLDVFFNKASAANLKLALTPIGADVIDTGRGVLVRVHGKTAHAMEPWKGENAIQKFLGALESLDFGPSLLHAELMKIGSLFRMETDGTSLGVASEDDVSGPLSCNLAAISLEDGVISVKCDIRYPVKSNGDDLLDILMKAAEGIGWEFEAVKHERPLFVPPDSTLVKTLLKAYETITGERLEPISMGGGTYCKALPNSVSFGAQFPGEEDSAHRPDEYISLNSLRKATHIFAEALCLFNGD